MKTVTLKKGIVRGDERLVEIKVRKPLTKQLRGTNVTHLMNINVDEWCVVLPRITQPKLDKVDFANMPAADLITLATTAFELMSEDFDSVDEEEDENDTGKPLVSLPA